MRAQLLLTALLALPAADQPPAQQEEAPVVVVSTAQFKALLDDNLALRKAVIDMRDERDKAQEETVACFTERST